MFAAPGVWVRRRIMDWERFRNFDLENSLTACLTQSAPQHSTHDKVKGE